MAQQIIVTKDNYGIGLSCNFIDKNKNPIDLTDKVVEVVIVDANNETIDIKQAVIVDYTNAKASIVLEKIHTSTLGLYKTFWSVLDENQNITAQEDVYYYVKDKNNGSEGIVGSDVSIEETVEELVEEIKIIKQDIKSLNIKYEELFQSVSNGKMLLASAITDKGVTTLATDTFEVMANNIRKITTGSEGGSGETTTPITIGNIDDITVKSGSKFNIVYTTNVDAVKHEVSDDGGRTFRFIYPRGNKFGYTYEHEALAESSNPYQRKIRVTDSNGYYATSNTFNITVSSDNTGDTQPSPSPSYDIIPSQSSYTIKAGQDLLVIFTSTTNISTCMLLFAPDYSNDYVGGYISSPGVFTFYTSSRSIGTYSVKIKGRRFNDSTQTYDDYYSDVFTLTIEDNTSGGEGGGGIEQPTTPITINKINDMTVKSGSVFNIVYTTNVDAVNHEMSFDGGSTFHVIYPSGNKNGYTYQHEAITDTSYAHRRVVRVTDANNNTATSNTFNITVSTSGGSGGSSGGGGSETTTPITISNINDMNVTSGKVFNITYTTNVNAVQHEMSFDGGSTFHTIHPSGNKNGYTYEHEALTETAYPHQRIIRVRDANGNVATSNTFNINVSTNGGGGGSTMSPFLASMYGDPRVVPNYPSGIQFPPINAHEDGIQPNGVNTTDSWKYGTRINQSPRSDWTRIGFWGQVYRQEGYGYDPDNVAVEIKDCKLWGWNGSSWVLIHDVSFSSSNTIFYVESFSGDSNKSFPSNVKLNGKNAIAKFDSVNSGYMFHPYSGKARANDYGLNQPYYYCSTMSARLVKWDSSGADNLDSAKLCFNVGGDFWHTTHETWQPDWSANGEYAQGQFLKCTREWKTAYCTNVPESWGNGFPSL